MEEGKIFSVYPLAAAVTHLLCDVLWLPQYRPHPASVATFMSISGKSLENYVLETMDIFLSDEAILGYLEWLTISINNGQSDTDSRYDLNSEYGSEQDLKNIVKRRIPGKTIEDFVKYKLHHSHFWYFRAKLFASLTFQHGCVGCGEGTGWN